MGSSLPGYEEISTDVLIIGAGGAGLRSAISAAAAGAEGRGNLQIAPWEGPYRDGRGWNRVLAGKRRSR